MVNRRLLRIKAMKAIYAYKQNERTDYDLVIDYIEDAFAPDLNSMEAQNAESKADFIHKMKIAAKEAEESQYWLWICQYATTYPNTETLQLKLEEINKVLGKILSTAKRKSPFSYLSSFFLL